MYIHSACRATVWFWASVMPPGSMPLPVLSQESMRQVWMSHLLEHARSMQVHERCCTCMHVHTQCKSMKDVAPACTCTLSASP